jgi:hypothetical protein
MAEVYVEGLESFRRGLRAIDANLGKELGQVNKDVGAEVVRLSTAQARAMAGRYPSYRSKWFRLSASANQRRVIVSARPHAAETGIRRHPVFGRWQDQSQFRRRVWPPPASPDGGYVVRPTVEAHTDELAGIYVDATSEFARRVLNL